MLPLMVKQSAGLVAFHEVSAAARTSGAEIVWLPERTSTRHSLAAPLDEDNVSV